MITNVSTSLRTYPESFKTSQLILTNDLGCSIEESMDRITNEARDLVVNRSDLELIARRLVQICAEIAK